jgi:hypothetical protein
VGSVEIVGESVPVGIFDTDGSFDTDGRNVAEGVTVVVGPNVAVGRKVVGVEGEAVEGAALATG